MERAHFHAAVGRALVAATAYLAISVWGLQYAYYRIFSQFWLSDDEGTMMLRVWSFLRDPASYDAVSGMYGPFYYLHKYAIYALLQQEVSHDVNRLTTIVIWAMTAAACAFFVHRLTRSILLAAVVQIQLVLHLTALVNEPGHPHEIALLLIAVALVLSTFVDRARMAGMAALGATACALLLVKVNLGVFLLLPLALATLRALPRGPLVRGLEWLAGGVALLLPAEVMQRHLDVPWGYDYCATVTLVIAVCLMAAPSADSTRRFGWGEVGAAAAAGVATVAAVCAPVVAWGSSLAAIANSVFVRAASLPDSFALPAPMTQEVVVAASASFFVAGCYRFAFVNGLPPGMSTIVLPLVKLVYGCFALYSAHADPRFLLVQAVPLPFVWLVLVPATNEEATLRERFPRHFLVLLAAFQMMQAYPVHGSQAYWAGFLVVPAAAVCIGDALRALAAAGEPLLRSRLTSLGSSPFRPVMTVLLLLGVMAAYPTGTDLVFLKAVYARQTSLDLPGAARVRQPPDRVEWLRWAVGKLRANCDGFVGMPGLPSLYFWTRIPAPGIVTAGWVLNLDDAGQRAVIDRMRSCAKPCVLYNAGKAESWNVIKPEYLQMPLYRYIQTEFEPGESFGPFTLLVSRQRSSGLPQPGTPP